MKILIAIILILLPSIALGEWLACDIPDPIQDVVSSAVVVDGQPEVIVPYALNVAGDALKIWDVASIGTATFEITFINSQGRRSDPAPFVLKAKPSPSSGFRIIPE